MTNPQDIDPISMWISVEARLPADGEPCVVVNFESDYSAIGEMDISEQEDSLFIACFDNDKDDWIYFNGEQMGELLDIQPNYWYPIVW